MPSPHFHILGAGNVGSLIGAGLRSTVPPAYVTFIMRSQERLQQYAQHDSTVRIASSTLGPERVVERKIPAIYGHPVLRSGGPEMISNLIVTTKGTQTDKAIEAVLPSIHKATNILLLQNGMGMYEKLCEKFWPNPSARPTFFLGITTHGVHNTPVPFSYNHAGHGKLQISQIPNTVRDLHIEPGTYTASEAAVRSDGMDDVIPGPSPRAKNLQFPTDSEESVKADYSGEIKFPREHNAPGVKPDAMESPFPTDAEEAAKADYATDPPQDPATTYPHPGDIPHELLRCGPLLNTEVLPYPEFLLAQYDKLIVNACVNPLTAILGCKNKELLENPAAENMIKAVVQECSKILRLHAEEKFNPDTMYLVSTSLDPKRLIGMVREVVSINGENTTSMLADVNAGRETELKYINDFLVDIASKHGYKALLNRQLADLVRTRGSLIRKGVNDCAPLVNES
ncbi:hypothetical protein TRICI_001331 [Trichomonascus ciferrii]|uniref:2-dehydropantoate 2-reductase n=1 Tax=Trichomonascus ciferrii TaxID=44093 RepID=A0A642V9G0_9ASCO|nr:hypothetical protein TRICI_001331 [Trichomonascus ciferrii]